MNNIGFLVRIVDCPNHRIPITIFFNKITRSEDCKHHKGAQKNLCSFHFIKYLYVHSCLSFAFAPLFY